MKILDEMGVSKLSAKVFSKANYSFKNNILVVSCVWVTKKNQFIRVIC